MPGAAVRGTIERMSRGTPAFCAMTDTPSAVALCSMLGNGAIDPGGVDPPGGGVGDVSDAHAAANSSDENASLRDQTIRGTPSTRTAAIASESPARTPGPL